MKTPSPGFGVKHARCSATVSFVERPPQIVCRGAWLQARIDAAFWPRLQHHPCFGLPGLARWQQVRVRVRGMHLDREHFTCIEKLQQQRESGKRSASFPINCSGNCSIN